MNGLYFPIFAFTTTTIVIITIASHFNLSRIVFYQLPITTQESHW
jgi:hypothetical protein